MIIFERKKKSISFNEFDDNMITFHETYYTIEEVEEALNKIKEKKENEGTSN